MRISNLYGSMRLKLTLYALKVTIHLHFKVSTLRRAGVGDEPAIDKAWKSNVLGRQKPQSCRAELMLPGMQISLLTDRLHCPRRTDYGAAMIAGANDAGHYVTLNNFNATSDSIYFTLSGFEPSGSKMEISNGGNDTITVPKPSNPPLPVHCR